MLTSQSPVSRRDVIRLGLGASGLALASPRMLFAEDPSKPDIKGRLKSAFADHEVPHFDLPGHFEDGQFVADNVQWGGDPFAAQQQNVIPSFASTQVPGCESATVRTLEEGRAACHAALRSGRFSHARIAVAQQTTDSQGRPQLVFPKYENGPEAGMVRPSAIYTNANQIGMSGMDRRLDNEWETMLANAGNDGASVLDSVRLHDSQLWTPDQGLDLDDPFMYAGPFGLFGGNGGRRGGYNNCQIQTCNTQCSDGQQQCGYAYGSNCRSGNCNLRPLGTIGGLLRGEFLRPLSSTGGIRHLKFGQRIVARLFPRVAYRKGWINCETAHLLLVKRLFWAIVIGVAAGTAGGGGGAAVLFLG